MQERFGGMADILLKLYGNPKLSACEELPEGAEIQIKWTLTPDRQTILDFVTVNFSTASPG